VLPFGAKEAARGAREEELRGGARRRARRSSPTRTEELVLAWFGVARTTSSTRPTFLDACRRPLRFQTHCHHHHPISPSADAHCQTPLVAHPSILGKEWVPLTLRMLSGLVFLVKTSPPGRNRLVKVAVGWFWLALLMGSACSCVLVLIWTSFELFRSQFEVAVGFSSVLEDLLYFTKEENSIFK
jgi:hypothetical protein